MSIETSEIGYLINANEPTPEQWADEHRSLERRPEIRLLTAVLDDAVRCYVEWREGGKLCRKRNLFAEAESWIFSERPSILPFKYVCEILNINPEWLRKGLLAARASGMRKVAYRENPMRGPKKVGGYKLG